MMFKSFGARLAVAGLVLAGLAAGGGWAGYAAAKGGGGFAAPVQGNLHVKSSPGASFVVPVSNISGWRDAVPAGGCNSADAVRVTSLTTPLASSTHKLIRRPGGCGTNMAFQLRYRSADTTAGTYRFAVFGTTVVTEAFDANTPATYEPYERLVSAAGPDAITVTVDPTNDLVDSSDSTFSFSTVTFSSIADCHGCEVFITCPETAVAGAGAAVASLRVKCY